jgi:hypothetical protein
MSLLKNDIQKACLGESLGNGQREEVSPAAVLHELFAILQ